jgi:quercetin dioxygenase-like cupin family protein
MGGTAMSMKAGRGEMLSVLGTEVRFLCPADTTNGRFSVMEVLLPFDQGPPPHEHPWDEAYYVTEGQVLFIIGEDAQLFRAGDFIYAPGGTVHSFRGQSEPPARVLVFDAPAAAEQFFREVAREVTAFPRDLEKLPQIGQRHQLRFTGQGSAAARRTPRP